MRDHAAHQPEHALLVLQGDQPTADHWREALEARLGPGSVQLAPSAAEAVERALSRLDLVITDLELPDDAGLDLLRRLLNCRTDLPVVVVAEERAQETALAAVDHGAYDYLLKTEDYLKALPVVAAKNLRLWRTHQENARLQCELAETLKQVRLRNHQLQQTVSQLETAAGTDPLTGLANRRAFGRTLDRSFAQALRQGEDLACLMIDLDGFKRLNDTFGHPVGDRLLERAGRVLEASGRRSDAAGRFGGDEFIVLLPETDAKTAGRVAGRVRERFAEAVDAERREAGIGCELTLSMGLATLHQSRAATAEQLVACADHALYRAKQAGRDQLHTYQRVSRSGRGRLTPMAARAGGRGVVDEAGG